MTFGKNDEAILAKSALANRARYEIRQVDTARRKFLENGNQTSRLIGALKHDKAGSVMTRRRRSSISTDYDKSGLVSLFIFDVFGEHTEPVQISGNTWSDCSKPR